MSVLFFPNTVKKQALGLNGMGGFEGSLRGARKVLVVLNIIFAIFICVKVFLPQKNHEQIEEGGVLDPVINAGSGRVDVSEKESFHVYEAVFDKRDLFQLPYAQRKVSALRVGSEKSVQKSIEGSFEGFKVVGIIVDKNPQVVVENIKSKETVFLSRGDQLQGAVLEEVLGGKAIFVKQGKRIEMVVE